MVDLDKAIDMADVGNNCRVALRNDSYKLHKILPNKVGHCNIVTLVILITKSRCSLGNRKLNTYWKTIFY